MIVLDSVSAVRAIRLDLSLDARAQGLVATRKGTTREPLAKLLGRVWITAS
jgi:hypothetical protein